MFRLFYTPEWFNGFDLLFDAIVLVIALLIAAYSWRVYKINGENKYGYFSLAFVLVGIAFLFKLITQGLVYYVPMRNVAQSILIPVVGKAESGVNFSNLFYRTGFFSYMVTMLGAWLLMFFVSQKKSGRLKSYYEVSQIALFVYLIFLISVVSNFKYSVFYLTSSVILGMTVLNYYKNYLNTKRNKNALMVMFSFILLLIANLSSIFVFLYQSLYAVAEVFLLAGFLLLLYTHYRVTR